MRVLTDVELEKVSGAGLLGGLPLVGGITEGGGVGGLTGGLTGGANQGAADKTSFLSGLPILGGLIGGDGGPLDSSKG